MANTYYVINQGLGFDSARERKKSSSYVSAFAIITTTSVRPTSSYPLGLEALELILNGFLLEFISQSPLSVPSNEIDHVRKTSAHIYAPPDTNEVLVLFKVTRSPSDSSQWKLGVVGLERPLSMVGTRSVSTLQIHTCTWVFFAPTVWQSFPKSGWRRKKTKLMEINLKIRRGGDWSPREAEIESRYR